MQIEADSVKYIENAPAERRQAPASLRSIIKNNPLPGFSETITCEMPAYVVPHSKFPSGYHCDPETELPFITLASQKNLVAFYHMGKYADLKLLTWFTYQYPHHVKSKLYPVKSCVRFNKPRSPTSYFVSKMSADEWIEFYERKLKR